MNYLSEGCSEVLLSNGLENIDSAYLLTGKSESIMISTERPESQSIFELGDSENSSPLQKPKYENFTLDVEESNRSLLYS